MLDQFQALAEPLIVNGYRRVARENNIAPSSKISDKKIIEIYQKVGSTFREISKQRNEHISSEQINNIVLKFFQVYEMMGDTMFNEHLKYELDKYSEEGLRGDYQQELKLF